MPEFFSTAVLIPFYSLGNLCDLQRALASVASQTLPPDKVYVVVNGPDSSSFRMESPTADACLDKIIAPILKILITHQASIANALNIGLEVSTEDWIFRLDSDDRMLQNRIEVTCGYIISHLELKNPPKIYYTDVLLSSNNIALRHYTPPRPWLLPIYLSLKNPIIHPSVTYNRSFILSSGSYSNQRYVEDYELWLRLLSGHMTLKAFYHIPICLLNYSVSSHELKESMNFKSKLALTMYQLKNLNRLPIPILFILFLPLTLLAYIYKSRTSY